MKVQLFQEPDKLQNPPARFYFVAPGGDALRPPLGCRVGLMEAAAAVILRKLKGFSVENR